MKKVELLELNMSNFKGTEKRNLAFDGKPANIYLKNEGGKSTIYTGYLWNQTGKDEFDRSDYEIKNTVKKELNSQGHEVETVLRCAGQIHRFKRVYLENWVKPKGETQKKFTGHSTEYYYNDVKCNAKEYAGHLEAIVPGNLIKLLTNPHYFNTLAWQDQRKGLLSIAGKIDDNEIINKLATPERDFSTLIMVLNSGKKLDQYRSELNSKKKLLKDKAVEFPTRIDEARRGKPDGENWEELQGLIDLKKKSIATIDEEINNASKAVSNKQQGIITKQNEKFAKENELTAIKNKIKTDYIAGLNTNAGEIKILEQQISTLEKSIQQLEKTIADNATNKEAYQKQVEEKEQEVAKLRGEWDLINAERFEFDETTCLCPTCKRLLEAVDIDATRQTLETNFNKSVLDRKKEKVDKSDIVKQQLAQLKENIAAIDGVDLTPTLTTQQKEKVQLESNLAALKSSAITKTPAEIEVAVSELLGQNDDAIALQHDITVLTNAITAATEEATDPENETRKNTKKLLEEELRLLEKRMNVKKQVEDAQLRIDQLINDEALNGQAIADIEQQEFDLEAFTREQMNILEERVNSKFKHVRFRLWHQQVNGNIDEDCVCEYKGVPYPTLNTAGKLFAGLDVLQTFSEHFQIQLPVFCDNRESVTMIPETALQIISLFVSPQDQVLRLETAA